MLSKSSHSGKPTNSSTYCKSTQLCEPEGRNSELKQNNPSAFNHSNALRKQETGEADLERRKGQSLALLCTVAAFPSRMALPSKARQEALWAWVGSWHWASFTSPFEMLCRGTVLEDKHYHKYLLRALTFPMVAKESTVPPCHDAGILIAMAPPTLTLRKPTAAPTDAFQDSYFFSPPAEPRQKTSQQHGRAAWGSLRNCTPSMKSGAHRAVLSWWGQCHP